MRWDKTRKKELRGPKLGIRGFTIISLGASHKGFWARLEATGPPGLAHGPRPAARSCIEPIFDTGISKHSFEVDGDETASFPPNTDISRFKGRLSYLIVDLDKGCSINCQHTSRSVFLDRLRVFLSQIRESTSI